jgi:hypothetical protein
VSIDSFGLSTKEKDGKQPYCIPCRKEYSKIYREINKDKESARHKKYIEENREKRREWERKKHKENPEKRREISKRYRQNNLEKERERIRNYARKNSVIHSLKAAEWREKNPERRKESERAYLKANPEKVNAKNAKRRALKIKAMPKWANLEKIKFIYSECSNISKLTGVEHHVDHIVPLNSKFVCGLHVHNNLQIITMSENVKKSNQVWPNRSF